MGNVVTAASVLAVGEPDYDSEGRLVGWQGSPLFMVEFADQEQRDSADSWERLALAVAKAARRFMQIDERGNVVGFDDLGGTDEYTPNYVSDPEISVRGVSIVADTKGELSRDMGEAMLRTLVDELRRLPFDTRVSGNDDTDVRGVEWQPPEATALEEWDRLATPSTRGNRPSAKPQFFVIERGIRCVLRDGVPDVTVEYLDTHDGWTTSLADARRFERERGLAVHVMKLADRLTLAILEQD